MSSSSAANSEGVQSWLTYTSYSGEPEENIGEEVGSSVSDGNVKKHRQWCFTLNNPTETEENSFQQIKNVKYIVYGREVSPTTETKHLQGFVYFENPRCFNGIKKQWPRCHWTQGYENRPALCRERYCKKDGDFFEKGVPPSQGMRTDLFECKKLLDGKKGVLECFKQNFDVSCKFYKAFEKYILLNMCQRRNKPNNIWLWGATGVGKTRTAVEHAESYYIKDNTQWWDGYAGQEVIVFDDFDGRIHIKDMLRYLDRYPVQGQIKGGYVNINSPFIYITSDKHPSDIYFNASGDATCQLLRRLTSVRQLPDFQSSQLMGLVGTDVHL